MPQMAEKTSPDAPPNWAVLPLSYFQISMCQGACSWRRCMRK
jgi:hypothetical protein